MKKIALLSALVLAMGFTACDGFEEPNPPAQSNPQESIINPEDISVAVSLVPGETYNLDAYNADNTDILIGGIACDVLPDDYSFVADVEASVDSFKTVFKVPATVVPVEETNFYNIFVSPDNLNEVYAENVTKDPTAINLSVRFNVLTQTGNQLGYIGSPANFYGPVEVVVVPFAPANVIEEAYYLVGGFENWVVADAVKFDHSDLNQYDDPIFTVIVDVTTDAAAAGWQWKIIPQSTFAAGTLDGYTCFGPETADASFGELSAEAGNGVFTNAGRWMITIDMEARSYEFTSALDYLAVITTGTNVDNAPRLYTDDFITYTGTTRLYQSWYLTALPAMEGINFMSGGNPVTDAETGITTGALAKVAKAESGEKITGVDGGLYYLSVNTLDMTYTNTSIKTISLIGAFNDWDFAKAVDLTPGKASKVTVWTAQGVHMTAGDYKLAANHSWDVNWGGSPEDLVEHGDNMTIDEEGDYDFVLDFSVQPNTLTVTKSEK